MTKLKVVNKELYLRTEFDTIYKQTSKLDLFWFLRKRQNSHILSLCLDVNLWDIFKRKSTTSLYEIIDNTRIWYFPVFPNILGMVAYIKVG